MPFKSCPPLGFQAASHWSGGFHIATPNPLPVAQQPRGFFSFLIIRLGTLLLKTLQWFLFILGIKFKILTIHKVLCNPVVNSLTSLTPLAVAATQAFFDVPPESQAHSYLWDFCFFFCQDHFSLSIFKRFAFSHHLALCPRASATPIIPSLVPFHPFSFIHVLIPKYLLSTISYSSLGARDQKYISAIFKLTFCLKQWISEYTEWLILIKNKAG